MYISVIIPVYNQSLQLDLVLHGFQHQSFNKNLYEVIVVDDGSDERINVDISAYKYSLKIIRQKNEGRASARNTAIKNANGKIIILNDADRIPTNDFIARHVHSHEKYKDAIIIGNPKEIYISDIERKKEQVVDYIDTGRILKLSRTYAYYKVVKNLFNSENESLSTIPWIAFFSGNVSLHNNVFKSAGLFNENFKKWGCEHFELGYRIYKQGYRFYCAEDAINCHLTHARNYDFYFNHFQESIKLFSEISNDKKIEKLYDFLLGKLSLQELEEHFGGDKRIFNEENLYFTLK